MTRYILLFLFSISVSIINAQDIAQNIKGSVIDNSSNEALPSVTIAIIDTDPAIVTTSDQNGNFIIENVPIGRYDLKISSVGYEPVILPEVIVTSAKEVVLNITLTERAFALNEVVIKPKLVKNKPLNEMASVSARVLSVEEA